jgi:hypothetical protein
MADDDKHAWLIGAATAALSAVVGLLAIWLVPMVGGTDTPTHVAFAMLLANPEPAAGLIATGLAPTSQLFVWLAIPFVPLGAAVAAKASTSLTFLTYLGGAVALGTTLTGRRSLAAPLATASFFGFSFAMGFFNFALAAGLGMGMMAASVAAARTPSLARAVVLAALGALTLHAHVIVFGMFFVQSALLAIWSADRARLGRSAITFALALLPSALVSLWLVAAVGRGLAGAGLAGGMGNQRLVATEQLENLWCTTFGGLSPVGWIAAATTLAMAFAGAGRRAGWAIATSLVVWLAVYATVPFHVAGWAFAQPRALLPLIAVLVGFAGTTGPSAFGRLLAVGVMTAHVATAWPTMRDDGQVTAEAVASLGSEPTGRALVVRMSGGGDAERRYVTPLLHVAQYAVGHGGVDPDWEAMNPVIHAVRAAEVPQPTRLPQFLFVGRDCSLNDACENFGQMAVDRAVVVAPSFDSVLVTGASAEELALFEGRGFVRVSPARFSPPTPRTLSVTLEVLPAHAGVPLAVRLVFPETVGPYAGVAIPPGPARSVVGIPVGPVPEGGMLVEVTTDRGDVLSRVPIDVTAAAPLTLPLTLRTGD